MGIYREGHAQCLLWLVGMVDKRRFSRNDYLKFQQTFPIYQFDLLVLLLIITNNVIVLEKDIYIATLYAAISKHGMKAFQPLRLQKNFCTMNVLEFLNKKRLRVSLSYNFNSIFNIIFDMLDILVERVKIC